MKLSESIKPISYIKAHAADIIRDFSTGQEDTIIVTQNGEAKAVLLDIALYERTQDSLALLKILCQSTVSLQKGRFKPAEKAFTDLRKKIKDRKK